jgi:hypothetical protein
MLADSQIRVTSPDSAPASVITWNAVGSAQILRIN